uniref:BHLH domain-containing protein n=1 Tax=Acrobeloides nanus TaxID=290746 RepID=A0A914D4P2_9BILA
MASTASPSYCQIRNSRNTARKSSGRVRKSSKEKRERAKTLEKLRDMVGSDENCSQLEIMQHVIDYIWHLQQTLTEPEDMSSRLQTESEPVHQLVSQLTKALAAISTPSH